MRLINWILSFFRKEVKKIAEPLPATKTLNEWVESQHPASARVQQYINHLNTRIEEIDTNDDLLWTRERDKLEDELLRKWDEKEILQKFA
ncbi:hypothetical protein HY486_02005 [Candidatus Woesearchaeota archaeon]|nr:hypothetical protein [Candidatus Woesearchaeota archaeon]